MYHNFTYIHKIKILYIVLLGFYSLASYMTCIDLHYMHVRLVSVLCTDIWHLLPTPRLLTVGCVLFTNP